MSDLTLMMYLLDAFVKNIFKRMALKLKLEYGLLKVEQKKLFVKNGMITTKRSYFCN